MTKLQQLAERAQALATLLGGTTPPTLEEAHLGADEAEAIAEELRQLDEAQDRLLDKLRKLQAVKG